ncbi:MAG: hypothetical protein NT069_34475 [Planctomycetota bacterium]|nr:hypothetical protein [Planctomycetota bacterium]
MDAEKEEPEISRAIEAIFEMIANRQLDDAQAKVLEVRQRIGNSEILQRAASTIERIRMINR